MSKQKQEQKDTVRQPIVVVMGHIDHGKSTLLDYIRKTNVVDAETGGITQHLSAYEVAHKDDKGVQRKITFLDTPGHEAFQKMRLRGAEVADIAILVVSAEEGVKAQTLEAYSSIKEAGLPYIVAINKIDKPNANVERTKQSLLENEIYLEGLGGDIPWAAISAKAGTGIPELLDLLLLVADLEELKGDPNKTGEGVVIEAHLDQRKGISATLIIRDGTLKSGMFVTAGTCSSPVRIFEDFQGKPIKEASLGSPVQVVGWSALPQTGLHFSSYKTKKEAETTVREYTEQSQKAEASTATETSEDTLVVPVILKTDVSGSTDALMHEFEKLASEEVTIRIIQQGVGAINETDIKTASGLEDVLVIGFNTNVDRAAQDLAERSGITIHTFDIIYKLSEWLEKELESRKPEDTTQLTTGSAQILKCFSKVKNKQVVGGRVVSGTISVKQPFKIMRSETEVGHGVVQNLQQQKADAKEVSEGTEFGAQLESPIEIIPGDQIAVYRK